MTYRAWIFFWIIGLLGAFLAVPHAEAQPRQRCSTERATAEARYLEGQFDEAARLLQACIEQHPLFGEEAVEVYRLLGLVYLYDNAPDEATDAVRTLLDLAPGYTPDAVQDPPSYVALVEAVRAQLRNETPALAPPEEAPREETAVEEIIEDDPPPLMPPPDARLDPQQQPEGTPPLGLRRAKTWLLATGGAVVVFTAALLAVGG